MKPPHSQPTPRDYVAAGFVLVPIPPGSKGPTRTGWNRREQCIDTPERAERARPTFLAVAEPVL